jgi:hypothetical protein
MNLLLTVNVSPILFNKIMPNTSNILKFILFVQCDKLKN